MSPEVVHTTLAILLFMALSVAVVVVTIELLEPFDFTPDDEDPPVYHG